LTVILIKGKNNVMKNVSLTQQRIIIIIPRSGGLVVA